MPPEGLPARIVTAVGVVGTGVASFLPWARSGERLRDSYDLVAVVGRLGLVPDALVGPSRAWSLLPLGVILTCIAMFLRWPWCTIVLPAVIGLAALGLAVAVLDSSLGVEPGTQMALVTGLLSVVGALMVLTRSRGERRDRRADGRMDHA